MTPAFAALLTALLAIAALAAPVEFHVATFGSDSNPGTRESPFATLEAARDAIRALKSSSGLPAGGVGVVVHGGVYSITKTFELGPQDAGTSDCPVTYTAFDCQEVRLAGGAEVRHFYSIADPVALARLDPAAREHALVADLPGQGVTNYGTLKPRGFGHDPAPAALEVFFKRSPMQLARWPNDGWAITGEVPRGQQGGGFNYDGDRPSRWLDATDVWMHGYWTWPWADSYTKIASIDTEKREILTEPPHGAYGYQKGKRYRVLNLLEELDEPGEYYVDRSNGRLYFWPPEPIGRGDVFVSLIEGPMVAMRGVSHVTVSRLTFEACRSSAIDIIGGQSNRIAGCTIRSIGTTAINMTQGSDNGVLSCDIFDTGDGSIALNAGDRKSLTPARNFVENCYIHDFGLWSRTYRSAVRNDGVGNRIAHNRIVKGPHIAILQGGNDHVVEYNDISRVCLETGDAGAFYMGRDYTARGNIVRYNYFHDLGRYDDKFSAHHFSQTMGVYLDDFHSGTTVHGNLFVKSNRAVMIGGGRDNLVENNLIVDCDLGVWVDARGLGWAKNYFSGEVTTLQDRFNELNAGKPPYSTKYPRLAGLWQDEPAVPKGNVVVRNICTGGTWMQWALEKLDPAAILTVKGNFTEGDPGFVDPAKRDFRLKPDSPALALGIKPLPLEKIGLYTDRYRTYLPVAE